ncbi:hypothetical protein N301_13008, partial [Charadrius vociferus]
QEGQVTVEGKDTFQSTCTYQTTDFMACLVPAEERTHPTEVSYQAAAGPKHSGHLTTLLNTTEKYSLQQLAEVKVSHSALYLCAV